MNNVELNFKDIIENVIENITIIKPTLNLKNMDEKVCIINHHIMITSIANTKFIEFYSNKKQIIGGGMIIINDNLEAILNMTSCNIIISELLEYIVANIGPLISKQYIGEKRLEYNFKITNKLIYMEFLSLT